MDVNAVAAMNTRMSNVELAAVYDAKVVSLQKDMINMQGDMALKLLDAVAIDPAVGSHLDMRI